jgi:hypothetical protein
MARVHRASAGMNLANHQSVFHRWIRENVHLNQESLKLAERFFDTKFDPRRGDQSPHVCHDISPCCVEDEPIDWLVERVVVQEGPNDECSADERQNRAKPFCYLNRMELLFRETHICCWMTKRQDLLLPQALYRGYNRQACCSYNRIPGFWKLRQSGGGVWRHRFRRPAARNTP